MKKTEKTAGAKNKKEENKEKENEKMKKQEDKNHNQIKLKKQEKLKQLKLELVKQKVAAKKSGKTKIKEIKKEIARLLSIN